MAQYLTRQFHSHSTLCAAIRQLGNPATWQSDKESRPPGNPATRESGNLASWHHSNPVLRNHSKRATGQFGITKIRKFCDVATRQYGIKVTQQSNIPATQSTKQYSNLEQSKNLEIRQPGSSPFRL